MNTASEMMANVNGLVASRQYQPAGRDVGPAPDEPDSGSINGGIDRAQRIASQLAVLADHACNLSDRLAGGGPDEKMSASAQGNAPAIAGHVDTLHIALSRQETLLQKLRGALEVIERRLG